MILLITINQIPFHFFEFVKPIEEILEKENIEFETNNYKKLDKKQISNYDKIIITGTSLQDNSFLTDVKRFDWIKQYTKPLLGICGGMHILSMTHDGELQKGEEIGFNQIHFEKEFLGMSGDCEGYDLHKFYAVSKDFEIVAHSKNCPQAIKHKTKPFYGVLFHPEVRNKEMIRCFLSLD